MGFEDRPEWKLLVALGVGLVLGLERERARDAERPRRWAGLRTLALTSLLGGVALQTGSGVVVGVAGAAVVMLALLVAWRATEPDPGLTTEVTLVLAFALGVLAQRAPALAFAAALATSALLAFRARLHGLARKLFTDRELQNALVLGVSALLILPSSRTGQWTLRRHQPVRRLEAGGAGDGGGRRRSAGAEARPPSGGALRGRTRLGFVSSAATIAAMGRLASQEPGSSPPRCPERRPPRSPPSCSSGCCSGPRARCSGPSPPPSPPGTHRTGRRRGVRRRAAKTEAPAVRSVRRSASETR
jgi:hypothetical protein